VSGRKLCELPSFKISGASTLEKASVLKSFHRWEFSGPFGDVVPARTSIMSKLLGH
jgi:hypothetical protein